MNFYEKKEFDALVISGPTGSGKNKIANILANHHPIMVINADAIQGYKKWKIFHEVLKELLESCQTQIA